MPRKIKQYTNPFLKAKEPLATPISQKLPNLQNAIALHQQGQLGQAESIYQQLLEIDPRNAESLHLLGVIAYQKGKYQIAVDFINQAIEINPNDASYYSNKGIALKELNDFDSAVASFNMAIALKPNFAEAFSNLGLSLQALKKFDAAVASYDKAIALKHDYAEAFSNRGIAMQDLKQIAEALASYDKAIALKPDYAEAYSYRGLALKELKQFEAAVSSYDKAIALKPDYADAYSNRGLALQALKQFDAALDSYEKAIALKPSLAEAYSNRGVVLQALMQVGAALESYDKAIALNPEYAEVYSNKGVALQELKHLGAAVASYDKAISLRPTFAMAYANRGVVLQELKQLDAAVASFEKAIALQPDYDYLLGMMQHAKMLKCDWQDYHHNILKLKLKIQKNEKASPSFHVLALSFSLQEQSKAAEIWVVDKHPYNASLGLIPKTARQPKIRIGYFSGEFRSHPVSILTAGLFEQHDKSKFELIAFSFGPDIQDEMYKRIASTFDKFIDVKARSDKEVALLSRELGIDIAIDLSGLTQDGRTGIFSYRAAPIQLSYIGYLGTMGADYYDYLVADLTIIPVKSQAYYKEKIVYLPSYQVNDHNQEMPRTALTRQELSLPSRGFVYCCFNANYKITPPTFDGWMRILKSVPESVLLLYAENQSAAENLKMEAEKRGVNPARLIFGEKLIRSQYLARFRSADLFLDTLPYNAGATASDALWAGLPVLTCMGESFASRVAASLLFAIGLPELVTATSVEYEELAIEFARNPIKLKSIKDKLESNRLTNPLFNTALFTKHIEVAYTEMYERHQADLLPDHIYTKDLDTPP